MKQSTTKRQLLQLSYQTAQQTCRCDSQQTEHPSTQNTADNTYQQISKQAKAAAPHKFASNESGKNSDNNVP